MAPTPLPLEQMPGVGGGGGGYLPAAQVSVAAKLIIPSPYNGYIVSSQEGGPRINTMSMSVLIDFIIQRTYHELTVLAEL